MPLTNQSNITGDLLNLTSTFSGRPFIPGLTTLELMRTPQAQTTLDDITMPKAARANVNRAVANVNANNTSNFGQDTKDFFGGMMFGTKSPTGNPRDGYNGFVVDVAEASIAAIDIVNSNPLESIPRVLGNWKNTVRGPMGDLLNEMGKRSPVFAGALGDLPQEVRDDMVDAILSGDFGAAGADAVVGAIGPYLARNAAKYLSKFISDMFGVRPIIIDGLREYDWPNENGSATANRADKGLRGDNLVNVGHLGHMEVRLGGLRFELPPAVNSVINIAGGGGRQTPDSNAGISFRHVQNIATLMIPGGAPVYQSLGIQGQMVEFVGTFLGFDNDRLLDADLHSQPDPMNPGSFKNVDYDDVYNCDPLYVKNPDPDRDGRAGINADSNNYNALKFGKGDNGAWAVSRRFQTNVEAGQPQDFEIDSGVVKIKYSLLIMSITRYYERDDRVYYKFVGLAVGGIEGGGKEPLLKKKSKESIRASQRPAPGGKPGAIPTAGSKGGGKVGVNTSGKPTPVNESKPGTAPAGTPAAKAKTPQPGVRPVAPPESKYSLLTNETALASGASAQFVELVTGITGGRMAIGAVPVPISAAVYDPAIRSYNNAKSALARADKAIKEFEALKHMYSTVDADPVKARYREGLNTGKSSYSSALNDLTNAKAALDKAVGARGVAR